MTQSYFEMRDVRPLKGRTWTPLREIIKTPEPTDNEEILSLEEWTGTATAAIDNSNQATAEALGWSSGLGMDTHRSGPETFGYSTADAFRDYSEPLGINLVIDQYIEQEGRTIWHVHTDLIVALKLVREEDRWFCPEEGWIEVIRLQRDENSNPCLVEMKTEFLRDYLAARNMGLYCSSYHERIMVSRQKPALGLAEDSFKEENDRDIREGIITGARYPHPTGYFWTRGALWRTEWIEAGTLSTRVRGDADQHATTFAVTNDGERLSASSLSEAMTWVYFKPSVVIALLRHRGAKLHWHSQETGSLGATSFGVHFGINDLGLITVYAKDIGGLATWEQRIWSAHNITPEGGVSKELFAAQMEVNPSATSAPESELSDSITQLNSAFLAKCGHPLLRDHSDVPVLMGRAHRFVAAKEDGLLELSKELTKLFIERINVDAITSMLTLKKGQKSIGSLKALEKLVALQLTDTEAASILSPLFGIYDLRLADTHLGSSKIPSGMRRAGVDISDPAAMQGRELLKSFVRTLNEIARSLA